MCGRVHAGVLMQSAHRVLSTECAPSRRCIALLARSERYLLDKGTLLIDTCVSSAPAPPPYLPSLEPLRSRS